MLYMRQNAQIINNIELWTFHEPGFLKQLQWYGGQEGKEKSMHEPFYWGEGWDPGPNREEKLQVTVWRVWR